MQLEGILCNQNCIFIDEAEFNVSIIKSRARSKAEKPAFVETKTKRATNITTLLALSNDGIESCRVKVVKGGTTGK